MKKYFTYSFLIILLLSACNQYKQVIDKVNNYENAIDYSIIDYFNENKRYIRKYDVFYITNIKRNDSLIQFYISPYQNKISITKNDRIGEKSSGLFPSKFRIIKEKLFIWNDSESEINENLLMTMNDFKVLDSIRLRYDIGIYDKLDTSGKYPETPLFTIDETIRGVEYQFVKKGAIYDLIDKRIE